MDVTGERISRILKMREMLLLFKTSFNLVKAAVVCAIMESISSLGPSSDTNEPMYSCVCLKLLSVYFDLLVDAAGVLIFSALISMP